MQVIEAKCLCESNIFECSVPASQVPLHSDLCHCSACRTSTGAIYASFIDVSSPHFNKRSTSFYSSTSLDRYFCSKCGCQLTWARKATEDKPEEWMIPGGVVPHADQTIRYTSHMFLANVADLGLASLILALDSKELPLWSGWPGYSDAISRAVKVNPPKSSSKDRLTARCHCGGIDLYITRPDEHVRSLDIPGNGKGWLVSADGMRYKGGHCACFQCRLTTGMELMSFGYFATANIFHASGQPFKLVDRSGDSTLQTYQSSDVAMRSFCSRCGATVSFGRLAAPDITEIAVGLLQACDVDGRQLVLAENWIEYTDVDGQASANATTFVREVDTQLKRQQNVGK